MSPSWRHIALISAPLTQRFDVQASPGLQTIMVMTSSNSCADGS
jgi:hypothetical protein